VQQRPGEQHRGERIERPEHGDRRVGAANCRGRVC
jgi:hypothetical protein